MALVLCLSLLNAVDAQEAVAHKDLHLTILHTNDTHGHLLPYSYPQSVKSSSDVSKLKFRQNIGGAARRGTLIQKIRAERAHETLLIDAGDICDGTPFSTDYHGEADIAVMNALGYDFACPGNHEYSNSLDEVKKLRDSAHFPLLSANSFTKKETAALYQPYIIREINGIKFAFFGLMTYDARTYFAAKNDLTMEKPLDAAMKLVPQLRQQADIIVAVTHIGLDEDRAMAKAIPGIDVIVGGHSHTLLSKPEVVKWVEGKNQTIIVQDFQWAGTLGRLDITVHFDAEKQAWKIANYRGRLIPVTSKIADEPKTAAVLAEFWNPIKAKYGEIIGEATDDFTEKDGGSAEYNLVADAVVEEVKTDFDIENSGGVRSPVIKGQISLADLINLDPFGNTIFTFHATGKQIKMILLENKPFVSGIHYSVENGVLTLASINGATIEDEKTYFGATNSYYANFILKEISDKTDTKISRLDAVSRYIRTRKKISPMYDHRRIIKGEK